MDSYPKDFDDSAKNADSAQYALIARNMKSLNSRRSRVNCCSESTFENVLGGVLEDYPSITTSLERLEFLSPFEPFVHRWEKFVNTKERVSDPEMREHVDLLRDPLEEVLRETIREKNDHVAHDDVTFDNIWTIFELGALVHTREEGHGRVFKLRKGSYGSN
jgi:hypothetical protein